jgi:hypothetical protein
LGTVTAFWRYRLLSGNRSGDFGGSTGSGFADTDWFTPVERSGGPATAVLDDDFRAWRSEFPDFYDEFGRDSNDLDGYSGSLTITPNDVRTALGPQADDLMTQANLDAAARAYAETDGSAMGGGRV